MRYPWKDGGEDRPQVWGKFLLVEQQKYYIKGVTYGTFRPDEAGIQFPPAENAAEDFRLMAAAGINTVRTYTVPPRYLLDLALRYQLKVMVGLPWEQHLTFLDSPAIQAGILERTREGVRACGCHPAILCYAIGNEIPAPVVRWYGKRRIERFLHRLYRAVKAEDPAGLCTYVNYPTTEYLRLPFLDFDCFNVYLETPQQLTAYLARLHNLCGDRPLVLAEIGLDSQRNGTERQAEVLDWQIRTIFALGCAGTFIFAWTDEWWRGGYDIEDWDFGLVDRQRQAKPALAAVKQAYADAPFATTSALPRISVVVCSYNGCATIRATLEALSQLDYPDYEVIIVNDGSTDQTRTMCEAYPFRLINTANHGLSAARNTGWQTATGEIVAYIDDDAYPDPHWLHYLAYAYRNTGHVGIGGPNIAPDTDGVIARCVAHSPGGPVHVLLTDEIAEHIPGCNMTFRRRVLEEVGGFDPVYRAAGDDVDMCWRIQDLGYTIGFHPGATVWHHRRNSVRAYWRQQKGYGKAEALLEQKWPEKYNSLGHLSWQGRIYGSGLTRPLKVRQDRVFHGTWGTALFQSVYESTPHYTNLIPLMPEWYFVIAFLTLLLGLGLVWAPLLTLWPILVLAVGIVMLQAGVSAALAPFGYRNQPWRRRLRCWLLTTTLHVIQPVARLYGRLRHGLTPWRRHRSGLPFLSRLFGGRRTELLWSEQWRAPENWLTELEERLLAEQARVRRGGSFDRWDLQVSTGLFSAARGLLMIEEHGGGKQYLKYRCRPYYSRSGMLLMLSLSVLSGMALLDGALAVAAFLGLLTLILLVKYLADTAAAVNLMLSAFAALGTIVKPNQPAEEAEVPPEIEPIPTLEINYTYAFSSSSSEEASSIIT